MLCANCHHDGRTTPATWQTKRLAVCDEHKAYHERLAKLPPLSAIVRPLVKTFPLFQPL